MHIHTTHIFHLLVKPTLQKTFSLNYKTAVLFMHLHSLYILCLCVFIDFCRCICMFLLCLPACVHVNVRCVYPQCDMQKLTVEELKRLLYDTFCDHLSMKDIENIIMTEENHIENPEDCQVDIDSKEPPIFQQVIGPPSYMKHGIALHGVFKRYDIYKPLHIIMYYLC